MRLVGAWLCVLVLSHHAVTAADTASRFNTIQDITLANNPTDPVEVTRSGMEHRVLAALARAPNSPAAKLQALLGVVAGDGSVVQTVPAWLVWILGISLSLMGVRALTSTRNSPMGLVVTLMMCILLVVMGYVLWYEGSSLTHQGRRMFHRIMPVVINFSLSALIIFNFGSVTQDTPFEARVRAAKVNVLLHLVLLAVTMFASHEDPDKAQMVDLSSASVTSLVSKEDQLTAGLSAIGLEANPRTVPSPSSPANTWSLGAASWVWMCFMSGLVAHQLQSVIIPSLPMRVSSRDFVAWVPFVPLLVHIVFTIVIMGRQSHEIATDSSPVRDTNSLAIFAFVFTFLFDIVVFVFLALRGIETMDQLKDFLKHILFSPTMSHFLNILLSLFSVLWMFGKMAQYSLDTEKAHKYYANMASLLFAVAVAVVFLLLRDMEWSDVHLDARRHGHVQRGFPDLSEVPNSLSKFKWITTGSRQELDCGDIKFDENNPRGPESVDWKKQCDPDLDSRTKKQRDDINTLHSALVGHCEDADTVPREIIIDHFWKCKLVTHSWSDSRPTFSYFSILRLVGVFMAIMDAYTSGSSDWGIVTPRMRQSRGGGAVGAYALFAVSLGILFVAIRNISSLIDTRRGSAYSVGDFDHLSIQTLYLRFLLAALLFLPIGLSNQQDSIATDSVFIPRSRAGTARANIAILLTFIIPAVLTILVELKLSKNSGVLQFLHLLNPMAKANQLLGSEVMALHSQLASNGPALANAHAKLALVRMCSCKDTKKPEDLGSLELKARCAAFCHYRRFNPIAAVIETHVVEHLLSVEETSGPRFHSIRMGRETWNWRVDQALYDFTAVCTKWGSKVAAVENYMSENSQRLPDPQTIATFRDDTTYRLTPGSLTVGEGIFCGALEVALADVALASVTADDTLLPQAIDRLITLPEAISALSQTNPLKLKDSEEWRRWLSLLTFFSSDTSDTFSRAFHPSCSFLHVFDANFKQWDATESQIMARDFVKQVIKNTKVSAPLLDDLSVNVPKESDPGLGRSTPQQQDTASYMALDGETVDSIADILHIEPALLVSFNHLNRAVPLKEGDVLQIPLQENRICTRAKYNQRWLGYDVTIGEGLKNAFQNLLIPVHEILLGIGLMVGISSMNNAPGTEPVL